MPSSTSTPFATVSLTFGAVVLLAFILVIGQTLLIPLVIAIFIWYLLNAIADVLGQISPIDLPRYATITASTVIFITALWIPVEIISASIPKVIEEAPNYQKNLLSLVDQSTAFLSLDIHWLKTTLSDSLNLGKIATSLGQGLTSLAGNTLMIAIYLIFLLIEQNTFQKKLASMFPDPEKEDKIRTILRTIYTKIRIYLLVKTSTSVITALISYAIMRAVGLDYAGFWAVIIFFFNYIPNIGSVIATAFPSILSLIQFDTLTPFIILTAGIGLLQFLVGNLIEPRLMGKSLNLSPLVILFSLVLWGSMWGVAGMYLSVPLMVVTAIILAEFTSTRPIAVLLSEDGTI